MSILLSKVWFDLWSSKSRTLQVVLVIALGSIAIGLVIGGSNLISGTIAKQWQAAQPGHIKLGVTPAMTDDQVQAMERIAGVAQAEGLLSAAIEWRMPGETEWQTARLESRTDFQDQKMELVKRVSGSWPERNALGVVKTADRLYGVGEGMTIEVKINDQPRLMPLTGTLKPVGPFPVVFLGNPIFYADRATFGRITGRQDYDRVVARDTTFDPQQAEATDLRIQDYFERLGIDSVGVEFPFQARIVSPIIPPSAELLNAIFLILGVIGAIIIVLGIFLVYNSISAIITQQINQIGVMKAIGARPRQVLYGYAVLVLTYSLLSMLISIPLGGLGARGLQSLFIDLLNLEDPGFTFDLAAVAVQAAVCLLAPLAAAMIPFIAGMRITVREAINSYGLSASTGLVDRLVSRVRQLPYSLALMIGNAFRNRGRVFFIELTLVLAGVIFMMVQGVNDSSGYTFDQKLRGIHNYQVTLRFDDLYRARRVAELAQSDPRIQSSETWLSLPANARPVTQADSLVTDARVSVFGIPATTAMYRPDMQQGRWLASGDQEAAVITRQLAQARGWKPGDRVILTGANGKDGTYEIVGVLFDPLLRAAAFLPLETWQRQAGASGQVNTVWVQSRAAMSAEEEAALAASLAADYEARGFAVSASSTFRENSISAIVEESNGGISLIVQLLAIMAVIIAVVGGVGLSGVISLNVLERRREIGVMRSIGASDRRVLALFIGEGLLLGWISWLVALPLSIPAANLMATQGLSVALNQQLAYQFSATGPAVWLAIVTVLAALASVLPARGATRISVRESLVYQ